jgi:hypothetical protein
MSKKMKRNERLDAALLEMAQDFRGRAISHETADKIIRRVLGGKAGPNPNRSL